MGIIAIIPARGGSKGLKNKNIYPILDKPLIQWTFEQALASKYIDETFVSTDDKKIKKLASKSGIKIIDRPFDLCTDDSSSESALIHAKETMAKEFNLRPDIIVFLQATSPLRLPDDIDNAISQFFKQEADSLFSMTRLDDLTLWVRDNQKWESLNFDYKNRVRRQDAKQNYVENGSIYIFKTKILEKENNRLGGRIVAYEMEFWQTWEVDTINEIDLIEYFMLKKNFKHVK